MSLSSLLRDAVAMAVVCLAAGCTTQLTEFMADVDPVSWRPSSPVSVVLQNEDTSGFRVINLLVSYTDDFAGPGIPLSVAVTAPDSSRYTDELSLVPGGARRKQDDFHGSEIAYMDSVQLGQRGAYIFTFTPRRELKGVKAIGMAVEGY